MNTTVRVLELSKDNIDMYDSCMQKCMEQNINNNAYNKNEENDGRIKNTFFDDTKSEEDTKSNFYPKWQERWGPASFKVDDKIEVQLEDRGWFLGEVTEVHPDGKLNLRLNNNDRIVYNMAPKYVSKVEEEGGSVSSSGPAGSGGGGGAAPPPPKTKVKGKKTKGKKSKGKKTKGKKTKRKKTTLIN